MVLPFTDTGSLSEAQVWGVEHGNQEFYYPKDNKKQTKNNKEKKEFYYLGKLQFILQITLNVFVLSRTPFSHSDEIHQSFQV